MKSYIKLSEYAKRISMSYRTAQNMYYRGDIQGAKKLPSGSIIVEIENDIINKDKNLVVTYARVSTPTKKDDLERQSNRLKDYCSAKGYIITKEYKEVASGLNDNRQKLNEILINDKISKVVVEHKDRLTRFGFNYIKTLLKRLDIDVEVINESDNDVDDLMKDFVSIITSFCARIYGQHRSKRKTEKIIEELNDQII